MECEQLQDVHATTHEGAVRVVQPQQEHACRDALYSHEEGSE